MEGPLQNPPRTPGRTGSTDQSAGLSSPESSHPPVIVTQTDKITNKANFSSVRAKSVHAAQGDGPAAVRDDLSLGLL